MKKLITGHLNKKLQKDCHFKPFNWVWRLPLKTSAKTKIENSLSMFWGQRFCRKWHKPLFVSPSHFQGGTKWLYNCRFCGNTWVEVLTKEEDKKRYEALKRSEHRLRQLTETPADEYIDINVLKDTLGL